MKGSTVFLLLGGGILIYLAWKTRAAINLNWTLSGISPSISGLATILNTSLIVSNTSTASVSLTNVNATLYYQGAVIATGGGSYTLVPGNNTITIPFTVSDLTILSDIISTIQGSAAEYNFQIQGTGLVNGIPISFSTSYNVPSVSTAASAFSGWSDTPLLSQSNAAHVR